MLKVTKPAPNRVDLELSAILDADMMAAGLDDLLEKSRDVTDGLMLYKITSFSMPTGGAIAAEMMRLPQLFQLIGHFRKCAFVSDIGWLQTAAEFEGKLFPGLEIKSFDLDEEAEAERWLTKDAASEDEEEDDDLDNLPV
ncbi:MAG: STAS/SEC14 domain-containing protein [Pseudomonadota bacterium]